MITIYIFFFLTLFPHVIDSSMNFIRNPGCNDTRCHALDQPTLFYTNHTDGDRTNHLIYSSFDQLTIMIIQASNSWSPVFNYDALFAGNYTAALNPIETSPVYSFVIVLRRLIEFNDPNDSGMMDGNLNTTKSYFLTGLTRGNVTDDETQQPSLQYYIEELGGVLTVDIVYPGIAMRDTKFPKLRTEPASYYLNIALQAKNYTFANPRFAFEFYLMNPGKEGFVTTKSRFIDDQYTPGSFNVWQLKSDPTSHYPSSMLWKPVVYLTDARSVEDNTLMQVYDLQKNITRNPIIDNGIFLSIYRQPYITSLNVSIGANTDGFFLKENYGFLQFSAGLDDLQPDATAKFVTAAVIVSFALPILVGAIAVIIILKRRFSRQPTRHAYGEINN